MSTVAIIQARMGSARLSGKVLKLLVGRPMLWHIVHRLRQVEPIEKIVVATTDRPVDSAIVDFCNQFEIQYLRGSEEDVLDRFYKAAKSHDADPVLRITGDCPFVDPEIITNLILFREKGDFDYAGVATGAGSIFMDGGRFPDGLDAECFRFAALERAWMDATEVTDREHVTPYIWRNKELFKQAALTAPRDYSTFRWTVDNEEDFDVVRKVYEALWSEDKPFLLKDILEFFETHSELVGRNSHFIGREGYEKLWQS